MKTRIKEVRKILKLSQTAFGEKLGVSRDVINDAENGRVVPKEIFVQHLCAVYGVNDTWLRTGQGEMFRGDASNVVEQLAREYNLDDIDRAIVEGFLRLDRTQRTVIKQYIDNVAKAISKTAPPIADDAALAAIAAMQDYADMMAAEKEAGGRSSTSAV